MGVPLEYRRRFLQYVEGIPAFSLILWVFVATYALVERHVGTPHFPHQFSLYSLPLRASQIRHGSEYRQGALEEKGRQDSGVERHVSYIDESGTSVERLRG